MYKVQLINALTHEILREKVYEKPEFVLSLIEFVEKEQKCLFFDERLRLNKAEYITHYSYAEGGFEVYKILLQLELGEAKIPVLA
nr:hypothetical protein [uncultured Bacillus sp.]